MSTARIENEIKPIESILIGMPRGGSSVAFQILEYMFRESRLKMSNVFGMQY